MGKVFGKIMRPQNEAQITKAIRSLLNNMGIFHYKHWQGGMQGMKGISDIIGIYQGKFLAIEVKTLRGRLSDHQLRFIDNIKKEGGIAFVARSVDDVIDNLGVRDRFLF